MEEAEASTARQMLHVLYCGVELQGHDFPSSHSRESQTRIPVRMRIEKTKADLNLETIEKSLKSSLMPARSVRCRNVMAMFWARTARSPIRLAAASLGVAGC
jgi:hypothetical protein